MDKVLLGMSGGVDSSASAILLKESGYEVIGATFILHGSEEENESNIASAKKVCDFLNIEHKVINVRDVFKEKVMDYFIHSYEKGETPNPCIVCNHYLKFGKMYEIAKEMNIPYIATGHYAKVEYSDVYGKKMITKSNAKEKDQTYVLYQIDKEVVDHVLFPLGNFHSKNEIREFVASHGLEVASKPDSQDICFIPDGDYVSFLKKHQVKDVVGNFIDVKGTILSKHQGIIHYTAGQRKGLGISLKNKTYVVKIENHDVVIGEEKDLYTNHVLASDSNFYIKIEKEKRVMAKIRYSVKEYPATIFPQECDQVKVVFDEPQRAVTKGQAIVFYDSDVLIGGAKIESSCLV